ncbi:AAA family ATPase [Microbacteriaceae bacterium VKM Ac-2855]|nr:AAA family ATPase [Microbacteriaceae bacterium VKM Ac-2855]
MYVTRIKLKNWRNFRSLDVELRERTFIIGPNASGKSNLLDALRFLRDVARTDGGGLQKAVSARGGVRRIRCLHARKDNEVAIEVWISDDIDSQTAEWHYELGFKLEGKGAQRVIVSREIVHHKDELILNRPQDIDSADSTLLTQTSLEQIQANARFRELADFFSDISFVHLVPQLLKYSEQIGGNRVEDDPFGQGFLERIARSTERTRSARLRRIESALRVAVPQFTNLQFAKDEITGRPHLEARYAHYRPNAGWQREDSFSDGTLRLIALLWSLQESDSLLLMEEPELSLNDAIVREIPLLLQQIQAANRRRRQILVTTQSDALLSNKGIDPRQIVLLEATKEGTKARLASDDERSLLDSGFSVAEVMLPKTRPENVGLVPLWD